MGGAHTLGRVKGSTDGSRRTLALLPALPRRWVDREAGVTGAGAVLVAAALDGRDERIVVAGLIRAERAQGGLRGRGRRGRELEARALLRRRIRFAGGAREGEREDEHGARGQHRRNDTRPRARSTEVRSLACSCGYH